MPTVIDVAAYILDEYGPMTTMKLQKLAYCSQAYCLATNNGEPLFDDDFHAWMNGPVSPTLYQMHRGKFLIHKGEPSSATAGHSALDARTKAIVDAVCDELSGSSGKQLSERTHGESPWVDAREGYSASERCNNIISKTSIRDYYSTRPVVSAA